MQTPCSLEQEPGTIQYGISVLDDKLDAKSCFVEKLLYKRCVEL